MGRFWIDWLTTLRDMLCTWVLCSHWLRSIAMMHVVQSRKINCFESFIWNVVSRIEGHAPCTRLCYTITTITNAILWNRLKSINPNMKLETNRWAWNLEKMRTESLMESWMIWSVPVGIAVCWYRPFAHIVVLCSRPFDYLVQGRLPYLMRRESFTSVAFCA